MVNSSRKMKIFAENVLLAIGISIVAAGSASADTQIFNWGTLDPSCTYEHATCASDSAFSPSAGGYRAGGSVSWAFNFDASAFASISSITMDVLVVGFYQEYPGNIDPDAGQIGNYFAIDDNPFYAFIGMTDGRDERTFYLPTTLSPGMHTFSVVAYNDPFQNYEGWAGVDVAQLTITGEPVAAVPEPESYAMLLAGIGLLGFMARRRKLKLAA